MKREAAEYKAMRMRLKGTMASLYMRSTVQKPKEPKTAAPTARAPAASGAAGTAMIHSDAASMAPAAPGFAQGWRCRGASERASRVAAMPKPAYK